VRGIFTFSRGMIGSLLEGPVAHSRSSKLGPAQRKFNKVNSFKSERATREEFIEFLRKYDPGAPEGTFRYRHVHS